MSNPDEIRAEIEQTRGNLSTDVNALTEKVSPGNVARRQADKARGAATSVKDRVMGVAGSATDSTRSAGQSVADTAHGLTDSAHNAPAKVSQQARGNPLAAGVIALGAGWLLGSMLPASRQEVKAAGAVKDNASTLAAPLKEAAQDAAAELKPAAQQAAQSVKSTAADAAATIKEEGTSSAVDLKDQAQDAKETVQSSRS